MSFQYSSPGGNLTAGILWMVLITTNNSWVAISEMKLPSGCEEVEDVELLSMEADMGKWDIYGVKSGNCMRTVQIAVTLEQWEGEENQGQRQSESHETAVPTIVRYQLLSQAPQSAQRFHTSSSMRMGLCLWQRGSLLFLCLTDVLTSIKSGFIFYSPLWKRIYRDIWNQCTTLGFW